MTVSKLLVGLYKYTISHITCMAIHACAVHDGSSSNAKGVAVQLCACKRLTQSRTDFSTRDFRPD
eukprot:1004950-Rhodomonas_salina.1